MEPAIQKYQSRLDALYKKADALVSDPELLSEWAKYLCVLTCGFIEQCVKVILGNYVAKHAQPEVLRFAQRYLENFRNPKMESICLLAGRFSAEWESELRQATDGELKDAVDSIVSNRHIIAHGKDVGLTLHSMRSYYSRALTVVKLLEDEAV